MGEMRGRRGGEGEGEKERNTVVKALKMNRRIDQPKHYSEALRERPLRIVQNLFSSPPLALVEDIVEV